MHIKILFTVGTLQVFHYATEDEIMSSSLPQRVYWQDTAMRINFGPFIGVHEAMMHYANLVKEQQVLKEIEPQGASELKNMIKVDFKLKKRKVE